MERNNYPQVSSDTIVHMDVYSVDDWLGKWYFETDDFGFMLEIKTVSNGEMKGGYVYTSESHIDAGDEDADFLNPVKGTISADNKTAIISYTSGWGGSGKVKLTLLSNGQMKLRSISSEGASFMLNEAVLTQANKR